MMKTILLLMSLLMPGSVFAEGVLTPAANPPVPISILSQSGIPFIKASSGTMGNNGAISAMTALPRTYSGGAYIYLPAGAVAAGVPAAATWYWFVGSSTTAGTVYNNTYTGGTPTAPASPTAFATTGPGAYTGVTGAITALSVVMPANSMGKNGRLNGDFNWVHNNSGGNKTVQLNFGAGVWLNRTDTTGLLVATRVAAANRGSASVQSFSGFYATGAAAAAGYSLATDGAVNTAADVTISITINVAVATDHQIVENYSLLVTRVD